MREGKSRIDSIRSICNLDNSERILLSNCPKTCSKRIKKALEEIRGIKDDDVAEDCFFSHLIEHDNKGQEQQLWRYMPISSFMKLCREGTITMSSIISMNDKSETCYANSYISSKIGDNFHGELDDPTNVFISSFSTKKDNLLMWYMYADMAKGVALRFGDGMSGEGFKLHAVDYSGNKTKDNKQMHISLNYLKNLLNQKISIKLNRWNIWQHFFKPSYYRDEVEIRLLLIGCEKANIKKEWVTSSSNIKFPILIFRLFDEWANENDKCSPLRQYPLELKEIMLGPLYEESKTNALSLKKYFHEMTKGKFSNITMSSIDDYR